MGRLNVISLDMKDVEIEKISEIDFEKLKSDLELLAKQPPVEVWPCYKNEEIDYDKNNQDRGNLITLCNSCHSQTNGDRLFWKRELSSLLNVN